MPPPMPIVRLFSRIQARAYRRSDGRRRGTFRGRPVLLLSTTGRRSGKQRTAPLVFVPEGEGFCVMGSFAGHDVHPHWYRNLLADPHATVQVEARRVPVVARFPDGEEYDRLWERLTTHASGFLEYRAQTDRHFPIAVLTPEEDVTAPTD